MPLLARTDFASRLARLGVDLEAAIADRDATITALTAELEQWKPKLHAQAVIDGTNATLSWEPIPGSTTYVTSRDGTDNRGQGFVAFNDPPTASNRVFIWLVPGQTYHLTVTAQPSGITESITVPIV